LAWAAAALLLGVPATARAQSTSWGGADVSGGGFLWRAVGNRGRAWNDGLELAWGPSLADTEGAWSLSGLVQMDVRAFATSSWAVGLSTHAFEVAARLGPFEPYMRVGGALLTVDDFDGQVSAELLSPRVGAGAALRLGRRVAIGVGVYSEYFWRWFGPSVFVRGLVVDLRVERPMRPHRAQK
jgi:hypothetical protein